MGKVMTDEIPWKWFVEHCLNIILLFMLSKPKNFDANDFKAAPGLAGDEVEFLEELLKVWHFIQRMLISCLSGKNRSMLLAAAVMLAYYFDSTEVDDVLQYLVCLSHVGEWVRYDGVHPKDR